MTVLVYQIITVCKYISICTIEGNIRDALRDFVPFVQFKNLKNSHGGVLLFVNLTLTFLKLYRWYQIAQCILYKVK